MVANQVIESSESSNKAKTNNITFSECSLPRNEQLATLGETVMLIMGGIKMKKIKLHIELLPIAMFAFLLGVTAATRAENITINVSEEIGPVNRSVFGNNMLGFDRAWDGTKWNYPNFHRNGSGVWDTTNYSSVPMMLGYAQGTGMRFVRFPGGCGAHFYNWRDGVGPISQRPATYGLNGNEKLTYGLAEFLRNAQEIGAAPVITISDYSSTSTPQDAAALVEYLNSPNDSAHPWAQLRAADGHPEPWGVVWFEYGNETYHGDHLPGGRTFTADEYVVNYVAYQAAMKAVDPNIKLGAVLMNSGGNQEWTEAIIFGTGNLADFYVAHSYDLWYTRDDGIPDANKLFSIGLAGADAQLQSFYQKTNNLISELTGRIVPIAITEFNGGFVQSKPVPYRHTLGNALINAEHIRQLMHGSNIVMGNYWQFANTYWGMVKDGASNNERPNYYPFMLYNQHFGDKLINAQVDGATYEITATDLSNAGGGYGVAPATGVHQDEVVDSVDLLSSVPAWSNAQVSGVVASETNSILNLQFDGTQDVDYSQSQKATLVTPDTWYRLTGFINSDNLGSTEGVYLSVGSTENKIGDSSFDGNIACNGVGPWKFCPYSDFGTGSALIDNTVFHSSGSSVKVTLINSTNFYHVTQKDIPVKPGSTYLIEAYVKTDNMVTSGITNPTKGVGVEVQDSRGYSLGTWRSQLLTGTNGWQRVSLTFTTKPADTLTGDPGTTKVAILLRGYPGGQDAVGLPGALNGTAWWDDVKLHNQAETKKFTGSNPWRYVHIDFKSAADTTTAAVTARRDSGGGIISGNAQFKNIMLRQLTPGNYGAVPYLSVNASKNQAGNKVYLMVVNKNMTAPITSSISLIGDTAYSVNSWTLNGALSSSTNESTQDVTISTSPVCDMTSGVACTFPAHSLTALEIDLLDTDGDGVPDARDNCPAVANANQQDSNSNGKGDVCDPVDVSVTLTATPNPVNLGSSITYAATVTNNGPSAASAVAVSGLTGCILSSSSIPSGGTASCTVSVLANAVGAATQTVSVSGAEVDPNTANNGATTTTQVIAPDLVPTAISVDKQGSKVYVSDTVQNQGDGATGAFTIAYYLSENTTFEEGIDLPLVTASTGGIPCTRAVSSLAPGASSSVTGTLCYKPNNVVTGQRYYVLVVDANTKQVIESSASNNVMATTTQVWW